MIRVALVSPLYESVPPLLYGGTERVVSNLCRGLREAGVEVTLFASGDSKPGVPLIAAIDEALRLKRKPPLDPFACNFKMMKQVLNLSQSFDVIHNHNDYWMFPISEMISVPFLTTLHGRLDIPEIQEVLRSYRNVNFVSISDSQREPLPDLRWLRTIHHGIDVSSLQFYEKPGGYLAFLGRISQEKRPEWAVEIAKRSGVPLKIAAKIDGKEGRDYYDRWVRPHVDGSFIEYVGEISETEKSHFLGNALGLVFPIDWPEPFGLVVIESLACGTPVLARPCGAVPELMEEGVTGFCHSDVRSLAMRVGDLHKINRKGCRDWVEEKFSYKRMTEDYIHVYRHLIQFGSARTRAGKGPDSHHHRRDLLYSVERLADGNTEGQFQG